MGLIKRYTSPGTIGDRRILTAEHSTDGMERAGKKGKKKWEKKGDQGRLIWARGRSRCLPIDPIFWSFLSFGDPPFLPWRLALPILINPPV